MKILYTLCSLLCLLYGCKETRPEEKAYNVLFIHAFHKGLTAPQGDILTPQEEANFSIPAYHIEESLAGIADAFKDNDIPLRLKDMYLGYGYNKHLLKTLENALTFDADDRPDIILLEHEFTLAYFLEAKNRPLDIPVIFCGSISCHQDSILRNNPNITGFTSCPDINEIVRLSQKLFPKTENIHFLQADTLIINEMARLFPTLDPPPNINIDTSYLQNKTTKEVLVNLKDPAFSVHYNNVGIIPYWEEFFSRITKVGEYPFLTTCYIGLGEGVLGGYMVSSYDETYAAANRACQILKGKKVSDFTIDPLTPRYIFDWNVMTKFHLTTKQLPKDSYFINQPFLVRHQTPLLIGFIFLVLCFMLLYVYYKSQYQQKQAAWKKRERNRKHLKTIIASIQEGVICIDNRFNIFEINQVSLKLVRLKGNIESYTGQSVLSLFNVIIPDQSISLRSLLDNAMRNEKSFSHYGCRLISLGHAHSFNAFLEISPILQERQIIGVIITLRDITEEQAQSDYINSIMNNKGIIIWQYNPQTQQMFSNYDFLSGNTSKQINVLPIEQFESKIHPDDIPVWRNELTQSLEPGGNHPLIQIRIQDPRGGYIWWKSRFTSLYLSAQGSSYTLFGVFINIQAHKQLEDELEKARQTVEQSDRLKSAFLANMSHEIRTPLNGIVGFANLLCDREQFEPEEITTFIETIKKNCDLLLALISDIIDISCIESNTINYHFEECDVNDQINQIVTTQRVIIPGHLNLIKQIPEETTFIYIDKLRLNQVITNLINNAVKFTEQGSITIGYTANNPGFLEFFVKDTGRGIPQKDLKNIFLRYFKKDNYVQGAGLGLSICQMFVNRFGGEITVESEVGVGTCFKVKIPRTSKRQ